MTTAMMEVDTLGFTPCNPAGEEAVFIAKVKMVDSRGFGFAARAGGADVYFHASGYCEPEKCSAGILWRHKVEWVQPKFGQEIAFVLADAPSLRNKRGNPEAVKWMMAEPCRVLERARLEAERLAAEKYRIIRLYDVRLHPRANYADRSWDYPIEVVQEQVREVNGLHLRTSVEVLGLSMKLRETAKWPEQTVGLRYRIEKNVGGEWEFYGEYPTK